MANPHSWLGREPAFPLKHLVKPSQVKRKSLAGRVITCEFDQQRYGRGEWAAEWGGYDRILSLVTREDIIHVPVWRGNLERKCRDTDPMWLSEGYEDLLAFLKDIAPRVKAVLMGNAGIEMTFWAPARTPEGYNRHTEELLCFVRQCADWVREAGGRPAFGTVDWDLAFDCYGDQRLRQVMLEVDALQVCFCGYTLVPEGWCDRSFDLYSRQQVFLSERERKTPYIHLMRYLDGLEVWSGCNGRDGLQHNNDIYLQHYGFKAGMYRP